jgi:hypothetical protein
MSDEKTTQEVKPVQPKARKTLGREEMFDVFKAGGETEFFARPAEKKQIFETEARTGPSIHRQITDAQGPAIKHETRDAIGPTIDHSLMDSEGPSIKKAEISDADGPTIANQICDGVGPTIKKTAIADADGPTISHQMSDANGPIIKNAEISDASGPTISHQMSDANGPIIKNAEISDASGPTIAHQMKDASGPVIKRALETTRAKVPTIPNSLSSAKTNTTNSSDQPDNSTLSDPAHRMDTFSVHMAERIAKMKLEQKETRTKMDDLEANTQEMQGKLTPKGK